MLPTESDVDPRLLAALGHPVRQQVLIALADAPASVAMPASQVGEGLPALRRHISVLLADDAVEPVDENPVSRLVLDERGRQELTDLLAGVEEAMQTKSDSAARAVGGEGAAQIESKLAILHFGRADHPTTTEK